MVDYLKMDIEGSEYEVINGLTNELSSKIEQISLEVHNNNLNSQLISRLKDLGYNIKEYQNNEIYAYR